MHQHAILTAVGEDRPGLVDAISKYILDCGCSIADSRMAILGGEFAMLILVAGEADAVDRLVGGASGAGEACGLALEARRTRAPAGGAGGGALPYELEAYSMDHPGIVQRLAHYLAERKVNIRALDTQLSHAPVTGLPLFAIHALLDVPAQANVMELRRGLQAIGAAQNIDVELRPASPRP